MKSTSGTPGKADAIVLDQKAQTDPVGMPAAPHTMDMLIDAKRRARPAFSVVDYLKSRGVKRVLDAATGLGYYSTRLLQAGFEVVSADLDVEALNAALAYGAHSGYRLNTVQADWRFLRQSVGDGYDAVVCLGNAFSRIFKAPERRRALAEFLAVLTYSGILVLDHRNYDAIINGYSKVSATYRYSVHRLCVSPAFVDEGLVRLAYYMPDQQIRYFNTYPVRKAGIIRLALEVGFQQVKTYDVFKALNADSEPDYLVHVAEKHFSDSDEGVREYEP